MCQVVLTFVLLVQHHHYPQLHLLDASRSDWPCHDFGEMMLRSAGRSSALTLLKFLPSFTQMQYDVYKHVDTAEAVFNEIDEAFMQVSRASRPARRFEFRL